jgi:hypothetical protein
MVPAMTAISNASTIRRRRFGFGAPGPCLAMGVRAYR